ncbi:MAG: ROK family protein [Acidobacteria bacterium]|nr:ROK family protein [Acidobacteriota bacterium]
MRESGYLMGIDLGGTKIAAGVFSMDRRMLGEIATVPTQADQPAEVTLGNLKRVAAEACRAAGAEGAPAAIGIGSTGPIEPQTGQVLDATSLPHLNFFELGVWVRQQLGAPVFMENDANCFALGEALQGAGAGRPVVVAVTLGTACGCGIVMEGRIYSGVTGNAGEVAFCPVAGDNFDNMLSGAGVQRFYERVRGPGSGPSSLSAKEIGDLGEQGDAQALEAWRAFGKALGTALGTIAAVLDPSICVVGGSVSARWNLFEAPMVARLKTIVAPPAAARLEVARAKLGPRAGVIGAAEYAHYMLRSPAGD